jgi:hypothetical protein
MSVNNISEHGHHHHSGAPVWGIFLLLLGVVFLLQTLNVLPWGLWGILWRFWPAIIIVIGLAIILRHTSVLLISLITLVVFGGCIGIAVWQYNNDYGLNGSTEVQTRPIGNLEKADIVIDFTAGSLTAGSINSDSKELYNATVTARGSNSSMDANLDQHGGSGVVTMQSINQYWPGNMWWDVDFTRDIPLLFDINSSASSTNLDLEKLNISGFNLTLNAGSSNISLPSPSGNVTGTISANAASVEITLPADAAVRIDASTSVGTFDIPSRFTRNGDTYETANYSSAFNKWNLSINTSVGRVEVK